MNGGDPNGGRGRQLPSWMLSCASAKHPCNFKKNDEIRDEVPRALSTKMKQHDTEAPSYVTDGSLLQKREPRRSKKKLSTQGNDHIGDSKREKEAVTVLDSQRNRRRIKRKTKDSITRSRDGKESILSADDITVEDLISIAEEYVNSGKDKEQDQTSHPVFESDVPNKLTLSSSTSNDSLANELSVTNSNRTGDPARDMLNLFLGPLLMKSQETERKFEAVTERKLLENESREGREVSNDKEEGVVHVAKNKGSLKDKVAMLLE